MLAFIIVLQVVVALFLIGVVLLQPGNKGGAGAAMGGAGSDTVFGARGANTFLSKITLGAAVCFMLTNFALSFMSSSDSQKAVLDALKQSTPKKKEEEPKKEPENGAAPAEKNPELKEPAEAPVAPTDAIKESKPASGKENLKDAKPVSP